MIALLAVVVAVEVGLLIWALVDLVRRPATHITGGNKILWLLLCVFVQILGPILYLTVGRRRDVEPAEEVRRTSAPGPPPPPGAGEPPRPDAAPSGTGGTSQAATHVARAAAFLYGEAGANATPAGASAVQAPLRRPAAPAVELAEVRKTFKGTTALDGLTLSVPEGSVFGFLGPNGAGKTTTLRILAGLARPTSGDAHVLGRKAGTDGGTRALIGYLPDVPAFYKWMNASEYLRFSGRLFGLEGAPLESRIAALLELADLSRVATRIGGYSRGMKQRLGIAQALINAPRLLLLDEPTSALDPIGRREVLDMVAALRGRTTVFFSTHILADVERVCDTVAIIDRGRVIEQAAIDELRRRRHGLNRLVVDVDDPGRLANALVGQPWLRAVAPAESGGLVLSVDDLVAAQHALPHVLAAAGIALERLETNELSLEDVFVDLVGERQA